MSSKNKDYWINKIESSLDSKIGNKASRLEYGRELIKYMPIALPIAVGEEVKKTMIEDLENALKRSVKVNKEFKRAFDKSGVLALRTASLTDHLLGYGDDFDYNKYINWLEAFSENLKRIPRPEVKRGSQNIAQKYIALMAAGFYWNYFRKAPTASKGNASSFQKVCEVIDDYLLSNKKSAAVGKIGEAAILEVVAEIKKRSKIKSFVFKLNLRIRG